MAVRPTKRARQLAELDNFRRCVPQCSVSALCAVLRKARDDGIPELDTRNAAAEAQRWKMERDTPFGPMQRSLVVNGVRVEVIHPAALLWTICRHGGAYADKFKLALAHRPPTIARPWRLALYSGNPRKCASRFPKIDSLPPRCAVRILMPHDSLLGDRKCNIPRQSSQGVGGLLGDHGDLTQSFAF